LYISAMRTYFDMIRYIPAAIDTKHNPLPYVHFRNDVSGKYFLHSHHLIYQILISDKTDAFIISYFFLP
jgi:hypothetical protein